MSNILTASLKVLESSGRKQADRAFAVEPCMTLLEEGTMSK